MGLFAVWLLWLVTARLIIPGFFDYHTDITAAVKTEGTLTAATWVIFAAASAWIVFARIDTGLRVLRCTNPSFLALLIFAVASVIWSINPSATLSRFSHLLVVLLVCLGVTMYGWHERRFQQVVRPVITLFLVGSLIFGLVAPDLAIDAPVFPHTEYYWSGLTISKNALGAIASTGAILWLHGWLSREVKPLAAIGGISLSYALIVLSRAATYILCTSLVCALLLILLRSTRGNRRYMTYVIGALVLVTIVYGLAVLDVVPGLDSVLTPLTALAGRDRTFSNRSLIWQITREHISMSPISGTGYGAFWADVQPGTAAYDFFVPRMFFNPGECHDGYLEITNDLGLIGLLLLFGYLGSYLMSSLRLFKSNYSQATLYLCVLFQQLLSGLSESNWLWLDVETLIFTLATLCLARHRLDLSSRHAIAAPTGGRTPAPSFRARVARR